MNIPALTKALKFACLPTLSLLVLLFFAFFSITKTVAFISSDDGFAIFLRIIAFLGEVLLVGIYYDKYRKEEIFLGKTKKNNRRIRPRIAKIWVQLFDKNTSPFANFRDNGPPQGSWIRYCNK